MRNMNFVLKLDRMKIPGVSKIKKIPDIEEFTTQKSGKLYAVKYFMNDGHNSKMFRISSRDKTFSSIVDVTICNIKLQPTTLIEIKPMSREKFLEFIGMLVVTTKLTGLPKISENTYISDIFISSLLYENLNDELLKSAIERNKAETDSYRNATSKLSKISRVGSLLSGVMISIALFKMFRVYIIKIKHWYKEKYIESPRERIANDNLFKKQKGEDDPAFALFNNLRQYIYFVTKKNAKGVIIHGPPGMSKTYTVKRSFHFSGLKPKIHYSVEKGSTLSLQSVYDLLYVNRKRILVLDDFDIPLQNPDMVNLLKAATDSYGRRELSLPREKTITSDKNESMPVAPERFIFDGKIIIITNLEKNYIDSALRSRMPTVRVSFDEKQVMNNIKETLAYIHPSVDIERKKEVLNYIAELTKKKKDLDISWRTYQSAVDARVGIPEVWKDMTRIIVGYDE